MIHDQASDTSTIFGRVHWYNAVFVTSMAQLLAPMNN